MKHLQRFWRWRRWIGLVGLLMVFAGCMQTPEAPPIAPTRTPMPTFTPSPEGTVIDVAATEAALAAAATAAAAPAANEAPLPTDTPAEEQAPAEPTATPTPQSAQATASQGMNVRSGPGTNYQVIGAAQTGDQFVIKGKDPTGAWWQVDYNGQDGWLFGQLVNAQNTDAVAVAPNIPAPPPPTATPVPQPTQPPAQPTQPPAAQPTAAPSQNQFPFTLVEGVESCVANPGTTYFEGFVRHRDNSLYNAVCVHIAFYGPRGTKCSGCDGVGDGRWGFSPFGSQPAPSGTTVEIYVVQCPASGMPKGGQTEQSGFGDLTPRSPKWVKTINESVECHGITFAGD